MDPMATYQRLRDQPRNILAIGILIIIVFFGLLSGHLPLTPAAHADSARMVSLYVDGQTRVFGTDATTVGEILNRADVKLGANDLVEPTADTAVPKTMFNINVYRARPVLIVDGYADYHISSAYQSPRLLAEAAGVSVYPEDAYNTEVITDIVDAGAIGEKVTIKRATPFVLHADGKIRTVRAQSNTVGGALAEAKVAIGPNDTLSSGPTDSLIPGMDVSITRVTEVVTDVTEKLLRPVQSSSDPNMLKGQTVVKAEGSDGNKVVTYRIHYRDGAETSRDLIKVVSQTDPTPRVVVVGTKVLFAGSVEYWRPQVIAAANAWGLDPNTMLRIMACESGGNATSVSRFVVNGEHPMGLFQYLPSTWISAGGTNDNILDGPTQIAITAKKMALYGTGPWQCK
jgi:uncharacterized protein YabE (DUF348 family)